MFELALTFTLLLAGIGEMRGFVFFNVNRFDFYFFNADTVAYKLKEHIGFVFKPVTADFAQVIEQTGGETAKSGLSIGNSLAAEGFENKRCGTVSETASRRYVGA